MNPKLEMAILGCLPYTEEKLALADKLYQEKPAYNLSLRALIIFFHFVSHHPEHLNYNTHLRQARAYVTEALETWSNNTNLLSQ